MSVFRCKMSPEIQHFFKMFAPTGGMPLGLCERRFTPVERLSDSKVFKKDFQVNHQI